MNRSSRHVPRQFWAVFALVPILLFALACGAAEEPAAAPDSGSVAVPTATAAPVPTPTAAGVVPQRGGTMTQYGGYPRHWDVLQNCCPSALFAMGKIHINLLYEPNGEEKIVCDICDEWGLEDGGKTMVFQFRSGLAFHDGTPITAGDAKYSLEKLTGQIDGVANVRNGFIKEYIESIEAPDDKTLKINLKRPASVLAPALTVVFAAIIPEGLSREDQQTPPVGINNPRTSGAFYLKEAVPDSHLLFEAHPDYFKKDDNGIQLPYLDTIRVQVFSDRSAATTALLVDQIDMFNYLGAPPRQFWARLTDQRDAGTLAVVSKPLFCTAGEGSFNLQHPVIGDQKVRRAMNLAADRTEYGEVRYDGDFSGATSVPVNTPFARDSEEIWNTLPGWGTGAKKEAEIEEAKQLLAEAGYPDGFEFELMTRSTAFSTGGTEALQRNFASAGLTGNINNAADALNRQRALDYAFFNYRQCIAIGDPDEIMANYYVTGGARNDIGLSSPEIDSLFVEMSSESDHAKRKQLYQELEDIIIANDYKMFLPDGISRYWRDSKIHGFDPGLTLYRISTNRGETWWRES